MIRENVIVTIRSCMKNSRGEVLEDRTVTYLHGSSSISPVLQSQLQGLHIGDQKQLVLRKGQEDADDDFTFDITVEATREAISETATAPVKIHLLSGFLGSGKTTAIREAVNYLLKQNSSVAVITNDQGAQLVDGSLFTHLGIPSGEYTQVGFFPIAYTLGTDFKKAPRKPVDQVVSWNRFGER